MTRSTRDFCRPAVVELLATGPGFRRSEDQNLVLSYPLALEFTYGIGALMRRTSLNFAVPVCL